MAKRYFTFLRAINVGGHNVRMEELRAHFEDLGLGEVSTFIASGNVIFESNGTSQTRLEAKIERHLESRLGYEVATFVRSLAELKAIPGAHSFPPAELEPKEHRLYVGFLRDEPDGVAVRAVGALATDSDELAIVGRELYWLGRTSMRDSPITGARIEKALGGPVTLRNINTVNRLLAKFGD